MAAAGMLGIGEAADTWARGHGCESAQACDMPLLAAFAGGVLAERDGKVLDGEPAGLVSLTWHVQGHERALLGWMLCVMAEDGPAPPRWVTTVSYASVRCDASGLVVADVTMFAGHDGTPIWDGLPVRDGDHIKTGRFRFLVTSIRTCHHTQAVTIRDGRCDLEVASGG